jgi:chemotaxis protein methyltransferase CheR
MTLSEEDFGFVQRLLQEEAGLVLDPDKDYLVTSRLGRLASDQGDADITRLLQRVRTGRDPALRTVIANAMTIQETYFFRDPWLFNSLRDEVLPALVRARAEERVLRIWCAASATGQEIYSLCLLLHEHFPQIADWPLEILATDYSDTALATAAAGSYSQMEVNRGLPAPFLMKYFTREGMRWRIRSDIRDMVHFSRLNLVDTWPLLPRFDLVLLRNVLIYFDEATRRDVLTRVAASLRSDGYLYMGGTESPLGIVNDFHAGADGRACHYRLHQGRTIP